GTTFLLSTPASAPERLTPVGSRVFFLENALGALTTPLWVSDGTAAGTRTIGALPPTAVLDLADLDGTALALTTPMTGAVELWRSDGSNAGTSLVAVLVPGNGSWPAF